MIRVLLLKTFIPVSGIFDNVLFPGMFETPSPNASRENSRCKQKINKNKRIENNMKYQIYTNALNCIRQL